MALIVHVPAVFSVTVAVVVPPLSDVLPLAIVQIPPVCEAKLTFSPELAVAEIPACVPASCGLLTAAKLIVCGC
jgi:hypothetical protein